MTDENQVTESQNVTQDVTSGDQIDYKSLYEKAQADLQAVAKKKDELLNETKKAKKEREEAAKAADLAQKEQAKKDGEFEKLWKSSEEEKNSLYEQFNSLKQSIRDEKIRNNSTKIAVDLAKGDAHRAELLSVFVAQSLANMADENGQVSDDIMKSIKKQFEHDAKYAPLLGGNLATGGGAPGANGSANAIKELTMSEFNKLSPQERLDFSKQVQSGKAKLN